MTLRDRAALATYRLRPLEPVTLAAGVAVAVAAGVVIVPSAPTAMPAAGDVTKALATIASALALMTAFVAGRDVDPARDLLSSTPIPYRRALVLRVVAWGVVAAAVVAWMAARGAGALGTEPAPLQTQSSTHLLFAAALTTVAARWLGALMGGGAALAAVVTVAVVSFAYERFPLHLLAPVGSPEWSATSPRLVALSALLLAAAYRAARP